MTAAEIEEQHRLTHCQESIRRALVEINARLNEYAQDIPARKAYMWEARRDMDHIEKIAVRQAIEQALDAAQALQAQRVKLMKLQQSPYFGRFDFARRDQAMAEAVYIGVHHFRDESARATFVYDWRAPISSMFYDYEIGPARFEAPAGTVEGELRLKRQFRVRGGQMEFMLESGVTIVDDVLQQELSRASNDEGMKNIVATIQRDQNAIIRNDDAHTLIIQGVAGSGKTSIALHRIAFLLYRFKDTLSSNDILIISPNRVFADYIGNVLPELGEERVAEIGMETLADELLDHQFRFQTFFEQTAQLLETNDQALKARIIAKASVDFLRKIDAHVEHIEANSFVAAEWRSGSKFVPGSFFNEIWRTLHGMTLTARLKRLLTVAEQKIAFHYQYNLEPEERRALRTALRSMARKRTLRAAYKDLFERMGQPELFRSASGKLEYADVFPLMYLKMRLEGVTNPRKAVKHLLIDEMQDYTPMQYAVLAKLFDCRKTVLGDATQAVNPYSASNVEQIRTALQSASCVKLTKSYRSTWEIMQFALAISPNQELEAMKRHGEAVQVVVCKRPADALMQMSVEIKDFQASSHRALALIAKTQRQADALYRSLVDAGVEARLLNATSAGFSTGVIVCTAHMAKGLEFDRVIVPDASARHYHTEMDRNLLYVACTRAMHRLTLFAVGEPSALLPAPPAGEHIRQPTHLGSHNQATWAQGHS